MNKLHSDFGGRAHYIANGSGGNFVGDGRDAEDCHGHGSHVAGTAAGTTYGVTKGATIVAGRVVNCSGGGSLSMVLAGVDWITKSETSPAVVNMSLGYGDVQSLRDAVEASVVAGYVYVVAAGNGNCAGKPQNACNQSPGGAPSAITVGATDIDDDEAGFSNYGTCVDILAPGVGITSAWMGPNNATATISGTSMATPHVAGAAALYLSANGGASPADVANALVGNASLNKISLHRKSQRNGTPNRLLFVGPPYGGETNSAPTARFTYTCNDLVCDFEDGSTDSDGTVLARSWTFQGGGTSTAQDPSHTFGTDGTYTVMLTVTDDDGADDSVSHDVTVTSGEPVGGDFPLTVTGSKVGGVRRVDLTWTDAPSTNVEVFRNGESIAQITSDGTYTDNLGRGGGSYDYQVCEAGTSTCSNIATVIF